MKLCGWDELVVISIGRAVLVRGTGEEVVGTGAAIDGIVALDPLVSTEELRSGGSGLLRHNCGVDGFEFCSDDRKMSHSPFERELQGKLRARPFR